MRNSDGPAVGRATARTNELLALLIAVPAVPAVVAAGGTWLLTGSAQIAVVGALAVALVLVLAAAAAGTVAARRARRDGWREVPGEVPGEGRRGSPVEVATPDGIALHAEVDGVRSELTIVFCHDLFLDLTSWRAQRAALVGRAERLVFFDHRGHGQSGAGRVDGARGLRTIGADLAAVVAEAAAPGRAVLVGHGAGAMAILAYAAAEPADFADRVAGVLLCSGAAGPLRSTLGAGLRAPGPWLLRRLGPAAVERFGGGRGAGAFWWVLASRLAGPRESAMPVTDQVVALARSADPPTAAAMLAGVLDHDERAALRCLADRPVTVVVPSDDRFVPVADQAALRAGVPGARVIRLTDCGHYAPLERPDAVTEQVLLLVDRVAPAGRMPVPAAASLASSERTDGLLQAGGTRTNGLLSRPSPIPNLAHRPLPPPGR